MKCFKCRKGELENVRVETVRTMSGMRYVGDLAAVRCSECHETSVTDAELERFELAVAEHALRFGINGAVKFARKALGMRANELAALLGLRPETISRWEGGQQDPDRAWMAVLATLAAERLEGRSTLERELRAQSEVKAAPPAVVRFPLPANG